MLCISYTLLEFDLCSPTSYTLWKNWQKQHPNDKKTNRDEIETSVFDQVGMLTSDDPSSQLYPFCCCIT